jgi:hypothetical protein
VHWQPFWRGFALIVGAAVIFNVSSVYHAWLPPCADCVADGGTPFPFIQHGGFFTTTCVRWTGVRDDVIGVSAVAVLSGLVSMRLFRSAR